MDVGMSIASTLQEIYSRRPDLGMWDLFKSGMNVGKEMLPIIDALADFGNYYKSIID